MHPTAENSLFRPNNNHASNKTGGSEYYHSSSMVTNSSKTRNNTTFEIYVDAPHKNPAPSSSSRGSAAQPSQPPQQQPPLHRPAYKTASSNAAIITQQQPLSPTGFPPRSHHTQYRPPGPIVTGAEKEKENLFTAPSGLPQYTTRNNDGVRQIKDGLTNNKHFEDTYTHEGNNNSSR